jgi:hypothetical protein
MERSNRNGNGVGQKWPLVNKDTGVFLVLQINRRNKLIQNSSVLLGAATFVLMATRFTTLPKLYNKRCLMSVIIQFIILSLMVFLCREP